MLADSPLGPPLDPAAIDAVVFDIGGVFLIPHHEPIRAGMLAAGFAVTDDPEHYVRAHYGGIRALSATGGHAEHDWSWWRHYDHAYLAQIGVADELLAPARSAFTQLFQEATVPMWSYLLQENITGFRRLVAAGVPCAIVSNNDGTAEEQLERYGICQVGPGPLPQVAIVVDSTVVGIRKPDPAIFTPALDALGTDPARTLYVGDTVHADVAGARAAGMAVVQLDPYDDHADFDHHRAPTVDALADWLLAAR